jgi:hypothetical protein
MPRRCNVPATRGARTGIVDGDAQARRLQRLHHGRDVLVTRDRLVLGDLEHDVVQRVALQQRRETAVDDHLRRRVHRHVQRGKQDRQGRQHGLGGVGHRRRLSVGRYRHGGEQWIQLQPPETAACPAGSAS